MRLRGNLLLLTAAFIWGTTFVAQMTGMDSLGPFSYAACRYFLGVISVLFIWRMTRPKGKKPSGPADI
jgi:drug/metabolite transporter (DMT)-like permease